MVMSLETPLARDSKGIQEKNKEKKNLSRIAKFTFKKLLRESGGGRKRRKENGNDVIPSPASSQFSFWQLC